ncbi:hypothetical protein OH76DRAFT_1359251 [Lentinus brumalis]|uniref:Protein kinase domain-containing protein n=1 Tax=Lentinus brumalis TaxID=2498619 RepID=A0A371CWG8_9APHY|nr:hypothetical protein OH76DRAFT_1359251 [Polyporus brumalis]
MRLFWIAYRDWLAARGFDLALLHKHPLVAEEIWCPPLSTSPAPPPYAERCTDDATGSRPPIPYLKCAPAQDRHGRDVTIKLVNTYTYEYRIYQDLLRCEELFLEDFQGVLPPVAILDTPYKFSFVVMPTWGEYNPLDTFETVGQVVKFMHCMLQGLGFLHSRRVAHRDIDEHNIMSNVYSLWGYGPAFGTTLAHHRRTSRVLYCLFDFNLSVQFPQDKPLHVCRLIADPSTMSGTPYGPLDVSLGVYDYNPFAYDVACLGNMFRAQFAPIVGSIPEFATLFDQMTTHVIHDRFTASEALAYFDQAVSRLPDHTLQSQIVLDIDSDWEWDYEEKAKRYWSFIPFELAATWVEYRTSPSSLETRFLRYIFGYRVGRYLLRYVRRTLRA